ncbi:hypothetical protein ACFL5O_08950 [Myxococcota bacterium]
MNDSCDQSSTVEELDPQIFQQVRQCATTTDERIQEAMVQARGKRDVAELRTRSLKSTTTILYR